ncbi:YaaA family protein [Schaalia canis]|uniref:Peroxide stress protein YaaA n=1 Tax=Schaalia canis TaxID=100469 RepID=A0A3P1SDK4_9ACTO|nr:peroxide stress protein YaaA [Schaalia canis]RRC95104.1 peroxide stress protein YaaA [Schaalia canis]
MQIWLPPSEGKRTPLSGPALRWESLSHPDLNAHRQRVADALMGLGSGEDAAAILGLGAKSRADLELNAALLTNPCAASEEVFTGVLFNAADLPSLLHDADAAESTRRAIRIFSGLFGVLQVGDLIPDHRLSMGVKLPIIGGLAASWRPHLDAALQAEYDGGVILDMRSGPYRNACPAPWATVWQVGVVREAAGKRSVVSHEAKQWRGLLTGFLLRMGALPTDEADAETAVASATSMAPVRDAKGVEHCVTDVEFSEPTVTKKGGVTRTVTLVTN